MKRLLLIVATVVAFAFNSFAQLTATDSRGISLQGIARDAVGGIYANQTITVIITIINNVSVPIYQETQTGVVTDIAGVFSTNIGIAPPAPATFIVNIGTSFSAVDFNAPGLTIKVEIKGFGSSTAITVGTFTPQSVPYAKMATYATNALNGVPPGTIVAWGGNSLPEGGWLWCDGHEYAIADYPNLYKAISRNFGGPSATTFNVPETRGMFLRGVSRSGLQTV